MGCVTLFVRLLLLSVVGQIQRMLPTHSVAVRLVTSSGTTMSRRNGPYRSMPPNTYFKEFELDQLELSTNILQRDGIYQEKNYIIEILEQLLCLDPRQ